MCAQLVTVLRTRAQILDQAADAIANGSGSYSISISGDRTAVPDESMLRWLAAEYRELASLAQQP